MMLAQYIGGNQLIIQTDYMEVVEIMKNEGFTANSVAAICDEYTTAWSGFEKIFIEHLCREVNQVVHELARQAMITRGIVSMMMIPRVLLPSSYLVM